MNTSLFVTTYLLSLNLAIRELRCIFPYLDFKAACTIANSIVHSKLDYCNSVYYNLPQSQIKRLQNIQNSLACSVTKTPNLLTSLLFLSLHMGSE